MTAAVKAERNRASESDDLTSTLQAAIIELEIEKGNLQNSMALQAAQHIEAMEDEEQSRKTRLGKEESQNTRVRQLETQLESLKQQRLLDSNLLADQDNRIASLTESVQYTEDELQERQQQVEETEQKIHVLTHTTTQQADKINDLVQFLEEAREQATISSDDCTAAVSKTLKVEEKLRQLTNSKTTLEQTVEELTFQKETALDSLTSLEQRKEELEEDLAQARHDIEALSVEILDTNADFNVMRVSHDAREREVAARELEVVALNKEMTDLKLRCDRLPELEALLSSQQEDLTGIEHIESYLVMDMQAVITRLEAVLGSDHPPPRSAGSSGEAEQDQDIRNPMGDLLYTPLKSLLTPSRDLLGAVRVHAPPSSRPDFHSSPFNQSQRHTEHNQGEGQFSASVSNAHLVRLRNHFNRLIQMADEHLYRSARLEDSSRTMSSRVSELNQRYEGLDQKHRVVVSEKESLFLRLQANDREIENLEDELENVREERDNAVHAGEDHAQWLRLLRRDLESTTAHEAIQTVLDAAQAHSDTHQHAGTPSSSSSSPSTRGTTRLSAELSVSLIDYGQDYPLHDTVAEVKATLLSLVKSLHTSSTMLTQKEVSLSKSEQELLESKTSFAQEKSSLTDQISDLMGMLKQEKVKSQKVSEELNTFLAENDNLKAQIHDQHQIRNEIEDENITLKDSVKDLRHTLKDAEVLCVELRSKIRQLLTDKEHLNEDLTLAREEVSISLRRLTDLELHVEQDGLSLGRLKTERDTLMNLKMQLTHELEMARRDLAAASRDAKPLLSPEDMKSTFELERLLAALGATLDHLHATMDTKPDVSGGGDAVEDAGRKLNGSFEQDDDKSANTEEDLTVAVTVTLSQRVETAVKRLASVRTWSRDERRHKRTVEETLNDLRTELERLKCTHTQETEEYRETIHTLQAKEHALLLQTTTLAALKTQNEECMQEVRELKKERDELLTSNGTSKQAIAANALAVQTKDLEISKLKHTLDSERERIGDMKDNTMQLQSELEARQTLCDQQDTTIRGLKAAAQRQKDSMERLETLLARQKKEKEDMDKKLKYNTEGKVSESNETTLKIRALEVELRECKQSHRKELTALTEKLQVETAENATALSSLVSLEGKLQSVSTDASAQRKELLASNQETERLRTRLDNEIREHKHTLASLSTVQALEADWRQSAEDCQVLREEADVKLEKALDQVDALQQDLSEVTDAKNISQHQVSTTRSETQHLKQSVEQLTLQLERSQRETQSASSRGSALRTEGRQIRSEVLAAVHELKEVTSVLHSLTSWDADADEDALRDEMKDQDQGRGQQLLLQPSLSSDEEMLGETLGAKQLHTSIQVIHQYIKQIQKFPHEMTSTHSSLRACELENARLQRELETVETLHADRVQRLHTELQLLESQLQDRATYDVTQGSSFAGQLKELEAELSRVKERAQAREEEFKQEVELLTSDRRRIEGEFRSTYTVN